MEIYIVMEYILLMDAFNSNGFTFFQEYIDIAKPNDSVSSGNHQITGKDYCNTKNEVAIAIVNRKDPMITILQHILSIVYDPNQIT